MSELEADFRKNLNSLPRNCQEKLKDGEPLSPTMVCQLFQALAHSVRDGKTKLSEPLSDLLLLSYKFLTASKIFSNKNGPINLFKAGTCALAVVLSKTEKYVELEEVYREFFRFVIKNHIKLNNRESEMVIRTMQETTRTDRIETPAHASCPYNKQKAATCRAIIGCQFFVSLIVALHCRETKRKSPSSSFISDATAIVLMWIDSKSLDKTCNYVYSNLVSVYKQVSEEEEEYTRLQDSDVADLSAFHEMMVAFIQLHESLKSNTSKSCTCAKNNIHNYPVHCVVPGTHAWSLYCRVMKNMLSLNITVGVDEKNGLKDIHYFCRKSFVGILKLFSDTGTALDVIPLDLFLSDTKQISTDLIEVFAPEKISQIIFQLSFLHHKITSALTTSSVDNSAHKKQCFTNAVDFIIKTESFYKVLDKRKEYLLKIQGGICACFLQERYDFGLSEKYVQVNSVLLKQFLAMTPLKIELVAQCCRFPCRVMRNQYKFNDAVEMAVEMLKQVSAIENDKLLKFVMDLYFRNKSLLFDQLTKPIPSKYVKTICDYLCPSGEDSTLQQRNFIVKLLYMELRQFAFGCEQPVILYRVLSQLIKYSQPATSIHTNSSVLLDETLHAWQDKFTQSKQACLPADYDFVRGLDVVRTVEDRIAGTSLHWQLQSVASLTDYLRQWEKRIQEADQHRNKLMEDKKRCSSGLDSCDWYPPSSPPDFTKLKSLANMKFTQFEELDSFVHHYCNSARSVAYILRLRGEWISAVQLLTSLEKSLPISPKTKDLIYYRTAIAIKSDRVEMLLKMNQTKLAMEVAQHSNDMLQEYEQMNRVDGATATEEVPVSKRGPGRYVTMKCKIVYISALVAVDRLREARMEFEAIVNDPFIVIGKSAPVKGYLLSAQLRQLSANLFVKSCHKNNLDEKIPDFYNCPVHANLHSYHAIMSLLQEIFPAIMKYNLNYDFDKSSTQSRIKFGQEDWQRDLTFQLELIDVYLDGLSTRVRNSHVDGQTRPALPNIIEGLNVSRLLLLPERELDFQLLLVEHASILRDCDVIHEELLVATDVVQYVNQVYMDERESGGKKIAKRNVLFSKAMESRLKTKADSGSTNETEKQDETKKDDDDGVVDSDDDILSKKCTNISSVSLVTGDLHCSPRLKKKTKKMRLKLELAYKDFLDLSTNLPKSNFFVTQQYTVFLVQCSKFFLRENFLSNVNTCLSSATNVIGSFKQFSTNHLQQVFTPVCKAKGDSNYFDAFLPEMEALVNMCCARAFFQTGKLDKCRTVLNSVFYILGGKVYNYQRKSKLLAEAYALSAYINLGFSDTAIQDKSNVNPLLIDYVINSTLTKNSGGDDGSSSPTRSKNSNNIGSDILKTPTARKAATRIFKEKPAALSQSKVLTDNLDKVADKSDVATNEVKIADRPMFKTPRPKQRPPPLVLETANLHTTPIKRTPAKWKKTPSKAKKGATTKKSSASGKTLETLSEFQIFDELLSGDERINLQGKNSTTTEVTAPTRPTRSSTRRLRSSSKNIEVENNMKHQRLRARRKFREANGPYYTDEEAEVERPSKRNTRSKKVASESDSQGENEMEMERRKSVNDSEHLLPITTNTLDADNELFAMRDIHLPPHLHNPINNNIDTGDDDAVLLDRYSAEVTTSPEQQLKKALKLALASGDFYTAKRTARYLARYHNSSGQIDLSSALHMLSIGLSFRSEILFRSFYFLRKIQKMITKTSIFNSSSGEFDGMKANLTSAISKVRRDQTITNSDNLHAFMRDVRTELPDDWSILLISHRSVLDDDRAENWPIMISKIRGDSSLDNLHLQLDSSALPTLKLKLQQIKEDLNSTSSIKEKVQWWTMRRQIDQTIADLVHDLDHFLGFFAPIMLGSRADRNSREMLNKKLKEMRTRLATDPLTKGLISDYKLTMLEVLLEGWNDYNTDDKASAICWLFDHQPNNTSVLDQQIVKFVCQLFESYKSPLTLNMEKRGHVFLILDKDLHQFPWESMAIMRSHSVSRVPSIDMLRYMLHMKNNQQGYTQADLNKVSYVVDPKGDLTKTGNRFQNWFESIPSWTGVCSQKPSGTQWVNFLEKTDVLIYCGHGSGSQFVSREEVVKSKSKACPMLMGCSSGLLNDEGISEPNGSVLSYLIAGSPCVLSYLWPVTDKDTDRYLTRCLNLWSDTGTTLTDVLRPSEKVCKMPMTNGAACIMYGMPVTCIDVPIDWKKEIPAALMK